MMQVRDSPGIRIDQEIVFSFLLNNPVSQRDQVQPSLGAESTDIIIGESTMSGLVLGAGSFPSLTLADIAESSTVQRSYNTLMMLIQSNARIPENSVVRIEGLTGSSPTGDSVHTLSGLHPYYFNKTVQWDESNGVLLLRVASAIPSHANRMWAFEVKNRISQQVPQQARISVSCPAEDVGCPSTGFFIPDVRRCADKLNCPAEFPMTGSVLSAKTPGEFLVRKMGQKTPYPAESNTLSLTLASSIEYRVASGEAVINNLSGLDGALAPQGPLELAGAHPFTSGCWACRCESASSCNEWVPSQDPHSVSFHVAADMSAGRSYTLSFDIVNPSGAQLSPDILLSAIFNDTPFGDPVKIHKDTSTTLKYIHNSKVGEAQPLFIRPVTFLTRDIAQNLPFPCAINMICVTLVSSVPLTVQKKSHFILQSFDGAIVPAGEIDLYAQSSEPLGSIATLQSAFENGNTSKGVWTESECSGPLQGPGQMCSSLKLNVACRIEAGAQISFCFKVTNPATQQDGPDKMTVFSSDGNSYQDLLFSHELLNIPYPSMDDRRPMYIRTPEFKTLNIEQSSPFPGDQNVIQIGWITNVPLYSLCNATISAKGLVGSTSASAKDFPLDPLSNATFGKTANWNVDGSLVIKVLNDTEAGVLYKAAVVLTNQNSQQGAQIVSVRADIASPDFTGVSIDWKTAEPDLQKVPDKVLENLCPWRTPESRMDCGKGDAAPLKIYKPEFIVASVEQSTAWPGATNELTVDLVANAHLSGDGHSNLTISKMDGLHDQLPIAPFIAGDVRKGAFCGQDPDTASDLFVMYTVQSVRERFGTMHTDQADHFVCVKVQYTYASRTHREILTTDMGYKVKPLSAHANTLNCTANGTWLNITNNQTENCSLHNLNILTNASEWVVSATEWKYYNGDTWNTFISKPTDVLAANVTKGVRSMQPTDDVNNVALIAGIVVGFVDQRSDTVFTRGKDKNVHISGDFLTPPVVALTTKAGSSQTIVCESSSGTAPWCVTIFESIGTSAKISVDVLNIDFNSPNEHVSVSAGGVSLSAELLKTDGLHQCDHWTRVLDKFSVPKTALTQFDKFDKSGQLNINLTTSNMVGNMKCSGRTLYAKITVETPAWDLFGPQMLNNDRQERVWNRWPENAVNPAGTSPWIEPGRKTLIGSGSFSIPQEAEGLYGNQLKLEMRKGKSLKLGQRLSFSFFVLNALSVRAPYSIFLRAADDCVKLIDQEMQGHLQVVAPAFILAQAGQSSPFPCSFNTITVAVISNVHLRGVDASTLYLTSFHGAYASDGQLDLSDASGGNQHDTIFSAVWTQDSHQVSSLPAPPPAVFPRTTPTPPPPCTTAPKTPLPLFTNLSPLFLSIHSAFHQLQVCVCVCVYFPPPFPWLLGG